MNVKDTNAKPKHDAGEKNANFNTQISPNTKAKILLLRNKTRERRFHDVEITLSCKP